jgi:hypothetical protein
MSDSASVRADNQVGDAGAAALAKALESNMTLTTLDLGRAFLGVWLFVCLILRV